MNWYKNALEESAGNYISWQNQDGLEYYCEVKNGILEFGKQAFEPMIKFKISNDSMLSLFDNIRKMIGKSSLSDIIKEIKNYELV